MKEQGKMRGKRANENFGERGSKVSRRAREKNHQAPE